MKQLTNDLQTIINLNQTDGEEAKTLGRTKKPLETDSSSPRVPPALTPEARENQMIALAIDLAEQQLRDGTASSQVITHFLKLGSTREKIEKEILEKQKVMIEAKTESLQSAKRIEELYANAMEAMKDYTRTSDGDD